MAFIKTIPAAEATDEVRAMYERQAGFWGYVPDYAKVFCHRPEVMERWGKMLAAVKRPVDPRRLELVTFAVAHELRHSGCSLAHGEKLAAIIGQEAVIAIANGEDRDVLSAAEVDIVRFARRIARDASRITSGEVEALRETHGLSDGEIFDIAAVAASRCFFTKLLDALGSEPDPGFMSLDDKLREALTVGRPISAKAAEKIEVSRC
ncbi:MAG: peroxidase [Pseudomonadota bacterium]